MVMAVSILFLLYEFLPWIVLTSARSSDDHFRVFAGLWIFGYLVIGFLRVSAIRVPLLLLLLLLLLYSHLST